MIKSGSPYLEVKEEIKTAINEHKPVVALESTIIAHGMPYPENLKTAIEVEQAVREAGAIPATIAIIHGKMKVGLNADELVYLGEHGQRIQKVSRRDIGFILARRGDGATTVAATMAIAAKAGISVFATGGIGGVHRGAAVTMDVSADLVEFSKTNVAVVSAGAKAILDLKLTLEYLETLGVPVIGYQTYEFPAFYTRKSGIAIPYQLDTPKSIAQLLAAKWKAGLEGGVLIANPIPQDYEMELEPINRAVNRAVEEAEKRAIQGPAITPFLLKRITELTEGKSLASNIQLVLNNAKLAAQIAHDLSQL